MLLLSYIVTAHGCSTNRPRQKTKNLTTNTCPSYYSNIIIFEIREGPKFPFLFRMEILLEILLVSYSYGVEYE